MIYLFLMLFLVQSVSAQELIQSNVDIRKKPVGTSQIVPSGIIYKANDSTYKWNNSYADRIYTSGDTLCLGKFSPKTDSMDGYAESIQENQKLSIAAKGKFRVSSGADSIVLEPFGGAIPAKNYKQVPYGWEFNFGKDTLSIFMDANGVKTLSKLWSRSKIGWTARFSGGINVAKKTISKWLIQDPIAHDDTGKTIPITQKIAWQDTVIWITHSFDSTIAKFPVTIDPNLNIADTSLYMDAYVDLANATTNYGAVNPISIGSYSANNYRLFYWMNLTGLPADITVSQANCSSNHSTTAVGSDSNFTMGFPSASWIEKGTNSLTWNNQPTYTDSIDFVLFHGSTGWKNWNNSGLRTQVESWAAGTVSNDGLVIKFQAENQPWTGGTRTQYNYTSKEYGAAASRPRFEIVYTVNEAATPVSGNILGRPWGKPGFYGRGQDLTPERNTGSISNEVYRKSN